MENSDVKYSELSYCLQMKEDQEFQKPSSEFRWSEGNEFGKSLLIIEDNFEDNNKKKILTKFIILNAYNSESGYFVIKLEDKQSNEYFLFINTELSTVDYSGPIKFNERLKPKPDTRIQIPIFEIQVDKFYFHVGDDGVKTEKKNVYQDIDSYLGIKSQDGTNQPKDDKKVKIIGPFSFFLVRNETKKETEFTIIYKGCCYNPQLEKVKESIVKQFYKSPCYEKIIFSCLQVRKTFFQLFTKFFVIIDPNFLFDTFNYWGDANNGVESDYKKLVKQNGISFKDAQQYLMDSIETMENFLERTFEDKEQYYLNQNKNIYFFGYLNEDQEKIIFSIFCLYGLLHAKYILTPPGQAKMLELYIYNSFPKCPRSKCEGLRCLPYGISEKPGQNVKMYCPKCKTIYNYMKNILDGAFFGPTYAHLLIRKFPELNKFDTKQNLNKQQNQFSMFGIPFMSKEDEKNLVASLTNQ